MAEMEIVEMVNTLAKMTEEKFQCFLGYVEGVNNPDEKTFLKELVKVALVQRQKLATVGRM